MHAYKCQHCGEIVLSKDLAFFHILAHETLKDNLLEAQFERVNIGEHRVLTQYSKTFE